MNETDTPETDAAECDASELYGDDSSGPSGYVPIEAARKLERERDESRARVAELQSSEPNQHGNLSDWLNAQ